MTTDPDLPPPPYTPSDPMTPTSPRNTVPPHSNAGSMSPTASHSSAAPYFEDHPSQQQSYSNVILHQLHVSSDDRAEDISRMPRCWRSRSGEVSQSDLNTFANFLLPPTNQNRLPAKLRRDLTQDEKAPPSPTDHETDVERAARMSQVAREWNEAFFYPRGLAVEVVFRFNRPGLEPSGLAPVCRSCVDANNARTQYMTQTRSLPLRPPTSHDISMPSQPPIAQSISLPQPAQNAFAALRNAIQHHHGRSGCERGRGRHRDFSGRHEHHGRRFRDRSASTSSSSSSSSRSSSSSSDSTHDHRRHHRGGLRGGDGGWRRRRERDHDHHGRGQRRRSRSSSSSVDSISSRETKGLRLADIQRSVAAMRLASKTQKAQAKSAMKELKRDLHRMKKDQGQGVKPGREEKREIKRELRGVKKEVKEQAREVKREGRRERREERRAARAVKGSDGRRDQRVWDRSDTRACGVSGEKEGGEEGQETGVTKA